MVETHHHRATLKQSNKTFKSKHSSKSALKERAKGRAARTPTKPGSATHAAAAQLRVNRKNASKQAQISKRHALLSATRLFAGVDGAPRIVAVVPLSEDVSTQAAARAMAEALNADGEGCPEHGIWKLRAERFKTSLQFVTLPYRRFYETLDACKAVDYVLFVLSPTLEVDPWGDLLLRSLQAQGLPEVVTCVAPTGFTPDPKTRPGVLKSLLSFMQYFVPSQTRVFDLDASSDRLNAVRALCEGKPSGVRWREGRPCMLAESVQWQDGVFGVTGVVRGASLSANRLVHIPNYGDFQIQKIMSATLPRPSKLSTATMEAEPLLLSERDSSDAESLVSTNEPETTHDEQTWPTEEEMQGAIVEGDGLTDEVNGTIPDAKKGTTPKRVKRIPKGMSEYQASWIVDEEDYEDGDEDGEGEGAADNGSESMMNGGEEDDEEMVDVPEPEDDMESRRSVAFNDLDMEEESRQLEEWQSRAREAEEDASFPDEVTTPKDIAARVRFQRYRGLRSFRTSPWDPYENLPRDYARIFQFEDFKRTDRNVRRRAEEETSKAEPGTRVTVYFKDIPSELDVSKLTGPFVMFGLLQHEHKVSVLNFTVQRNTEYTEPVRSKDSLILCVGARRFRTKPVYSQHTRGGGKGSNNVHKFERWLRHGVTSVATTYGPVVFGNQPCLLLRETEDAQEPQLVAMGSFMNADTTRVIAKRITLTGHPFKVHKKTATVRYMFFNSDDIAYFAPIQLHTKYGRVGHIKESLGTHGYFKAYFDGPISQMDTICMSLYKRVYPRWAGLWKVDDRAKIESVPEDAMEE